MVTDLMNDHNLDFSLQIASIDYIKHDVCIININTNININIVIINNNNINTVIYSNFFINVVGLFGIITTKRLRLCFTDRSRSLQIM